MRGLALAFNQPGGPDVPVEGPRYVTIHRRTDAPRLVVSALWPKPDDTPADVVDTVAGIEAEAIYAALRDTLPDETYEVLVSLMTDNTREAA